MSGGELVGVECGHALMDDTDWCDKTHKQQHGRDLLTQYILIGCSSSTAAATDFDVGVACTLIMYL